MVAAATGWMASLPAPWRTTLGRFVLRRMALAVLTLWLVTVAVFTITNVLPGNPAVVRLGSFTTPEALEKEEHRLGLDRPLLERYRDFVTGAVTGDLGESFKTERPVARDLAQRLPATIELALSATLLAAAIGLPLGFAAAVRRDSPLDHFARNLSAFSAAMPLFWLGLILTFLFVFTWDIAPAPLGRIGLEVDRPGRITGLFLVDSILHGDGGALRSSFSLLVMPAVTLAIIEVAPITKTARSAMLEIMQTEYVRTARAMGLSGWQVFRQDALRNALIPVLTMMGIVLGYLVAGNVIVERVFAWPGIGLYAFDAVRSNDFNAIQGFVLLVAVIYVVLNLVIDLLYAVIDPRIRLG